ncbi:helix-turn-helix domain-containing protein [Desulfobacula phenolica]|uniref:helix-turn-helix domain-containing protein n=1 Tax=Desulfobacula phenolica TaxID=90732 RepID=UPI000B87E842|nr:helix-turn-helix domain-containing protein [Desulfobacula phenolica]
MGCKTFHRLRVEAAKRIMETQNCGFDEIACRVGYENSGHFRKVFTELCHISPKKYRTKWGKVTFPVDPEKMITDPFLG